MNYNHATITPLTLSLSDKISIEGTYVMIITITFSQIAKLANQASRCKVRICPRRKPRSMNMTSATMTIEVD